MNITGDKFRHKLINLNNHNESVPHIESDGNTNSLAYELVQSFASPALDGNQ